MKQQSAVLAQIREMILQGRLAPGERLSEASVADMLGLSRTPVRQALPVLAREGLLVESGARGFAVRGFTFREVLEAVELRGLLEGHAARKIAEKGAPRALVRSLRECLADGDVILAQGKLTEERANAYGEMNGRFHRMIVAASGQGFLADTLVRIHGIPFADPALIAFDRRDAAQMFGDLVYAHRQHHEIVDALDQGEGARAESLLREHVHVQKRSMNLDRAESGGTETGDSRIVAFRR
jgi:GntR family transcriptional regulator of vanillate catabolism